jgi:hypothetical protein
MDRTCSGTGPTSLTGMQYQSDWYDRIQHALKIWFPYITVVISLSFEHFSFVKITMLHPSLYLGRQDHIIFGSTAQSVPFVIVEIDAGSLYIWVDSPISA